MASLHATKWLAYTRPDIAYSTKELARDLAAPTELSNKRIKHLPRYLQGTKHYKFITQPTTTLNSDTNNCLGLEIYVDADWAGCPTTRKSTPGFNIKLLNTTIAFGSAQQNYAICTGANEGLHLRSFLLETNICATINIRIHTDSAAGKSTTRFKQTSKTHRPQVPLHTRPHQEQRYQNSKDQHTSQQCRHLNKVHYKDTLTILVQSLSMSV